jgi:predicted  nucleic acid-binding Zn-ribbon protein
MTQAEALLALQEIDLNLIRNQKRLQELTAMLAGNQGVSDAEAKVAEALKQLTPVQTQARNLELEIQSNASKIANTDEQLYGGRVRNPKELQEMQQEIQSVKKRNVELEDHLLETMVIIEDGEKLLTEAQAQLNEVTQAWENEHKQLLDEQSQLESQVKALRQKREQALTPITPENQQLYASLRTKKNNQPISALDGNTCSVCGVEQTLAIMKNVRQEQGLVYCGNCGRILVAKS